MSKEKKAKVIDELEETFTKSKIGILTDFRGIKSGEINDLRRKLRAAGVEYRVVKNTLARIAAEKAGKKDLADLFKGQVAIATGYGDVAQPAKVLADYIRSTKSALTIKGGFLETKTLDAGSIKTLATLPPREVLIGRVLGGMQGPIVRLVYTLSAPLAGLMGVLQARMKQMEAK